MTRIKICGLTREADVDAAVAEGADALGFVLWAGSARAVSLERARGLARRIPAFVAVVGLFVNETRQNVARAAAEIGLTHLQFHGNETPEDLLGWDRPVIRALRVAPGGDLLSSMASSPDVSAFLLDADSRGFGGAGEVFDWSLVPSRAPRPLILAGGLSVENVSQAVLRVRPYAVDVSSGVEARDEAGKALRGQKDVARIKRFIAEVRRADLAVGG